MAEAYELIVKAWTEPEPFGWEGKYYKYRAVSIWPRPVQKPHPRVLMSASSPESAKFAAEHRAIMGVVQLPDLEGAKRSIEVYRQTARANGWEPTADDILIGAHTLVADTFEEAKAHLDAGTKYFFDVLAGGTRSAMRIVQQKTRYYKDKSFLEQASSRRATLKTATIEERIDRNIVLCGTPEMVVEQIKHMKKELGHGIMNINMKIGNVPDEVVRHSMKLWGERVAPHVRDL